MSTTIIPGPNVFRAVSGSLFSSPINWSRGFVPTGSDVAMIADNCVIDISRTVGSLIVQPTFTASINTGLTLQVNNVINVMGQLSCSGAPNIFSFARKNIINSLSPGTSTFTYTGSANQSVAGGNYHNLNIRTMGNVAGTFPIFNKIAIGNISVSGALVVNLNTIFELDRYNLNVSGSVTLGEGNFHRIRKSQPGNVVFNSLVNYGGSNNFQGVEFGNGSPTVELQNGISFGDAQNSVFSSGNGIWYFTTNNQSLNNAASAQSRIFDASLIISGAITLTQIGGGPIFLNSTVNGTDPNSIFRVQGRLYFNTVRSTIGIMSTGSFDFTSSAASVLGYTFTDNFTLPYTYYRGLYVANAGVKSLSGSTSVSGSLEMPLASTLDLRSFNLNVSGTTVLAGGSNSRIIGSGSGYSTFRGQLITGGSGNVNGIDFSNSTRTTEFQGGMNIADTFGLIFNLGTGLTRFTTNNQAILAGSTASTMSFYGPVSIENISVTNSLNNPIYLYAPINGTTAGSTFKNNTNLYFSNSASLNGSFLTGALDLSTVNNAVGLVGNYDGTTPARFNTFFNLVVGGTGVKTLGTSSFISGSLTFTSPATFELSSSNLFVNGTTNTNNGIAITRSGSGTTVFNGRVTQLDFGRIDFSRGNANVEFRNGVDSRFQAFVFLGSGSAIFSTNDQSYLGYIVTTGDIIISGSIRLRNQAQLDINKAINGTIPSSILDNSGSIYFTSPAACNNSMLTGSFISASFPGSVLGFAFTGSYKIPFSSFRNLVLNPGGIVTSPESKTLSGDTIIFENVSITRDTIDTQNNNLAVLGTTFSVGGGIKKSGSGSVLLSGSIDLFDNGAIDFISASNASLEMRGGIIRGTFGSRINMGTTPVTYSINNQNIVACNNSNQYQNILISGSITVGFGLQAGTFVISGSLNGTEVNSRFFLSASSTVIYNSSQQPMQIGILDVSSSANATFIYNSGSQNVKGGTYRNLTFLNGLKTLQGNVSVLGTFSTGSGATSASINLNGFTLTNP